MQTSTSPQNPAARLTLEQRRAIDAWEKSASYKREHVTFVKGMPALIMTSGLMQTLAYCQHKGSEKERVASDLRNWLTTTIIGSTNKGDFHPFMEHLLSVTSGEYQELTTEAMAWLRWMRQIAATRTTEHGGEGS